MPKQEFPKYVFHATMPAQLVHTPEVLARLLADGWAEDPDTAAGRPRPDGGEAAIWPGDLPPAMRTPPPKIEYPKWVFRFGGEPKLVTSEAEHLALPPGWYESPDEARMAGAGAPAVVETPLPTRPDTGASGPSDVIDPSTPERPSPPPATVMKSPLLNVADMTADEAIAYAGTLLDPDDVALSLTLEAEAKGKNRKTVLAALMDQLNVIKARLAAPPPAAV